MLAAVLHTIGCTTPTPLAKRDRDIVYASKPVEPVNVAFTLLSEIRHNKVWSSLAEVGPFYRFGRFETVEENTEPGSTNADIMVTAKIQEFHTTNHFPPSATGSDGLGLEFLVRLPEFLTLIGPDIDPTWLHVAEYFIIFEAKSVRTGRLLKKWECQRRVYHRMVITGDMVPFALIECQIDFLRFLHDIAGDFAREPRTFAVLTAEQHSIDLLRQYLLAPPVRGGGYKKEWLEEIAPGDLTAARWRALCDHLTAECRSEDNLFFYLATDSTSGEDGQLRLRSGIELDTALQDLARLPASKKVAIILLRNDKEITRAKIDRPESVVVMLHLRERGPGQLADADAEFIQQSLVEALDRSPQGNLRQVFSVLEESLGKGLEQLGIASRFEFPGTDNVLISCGAGTAPTAGQVTAQQR